MKTVLVSAVALIDAQERILLAQRPQGKPMAGLWEFPGGKVHEGETPEAALIRELKEELAIGIQPQHLEAFTFVSHGYETFHLLLLLYLCRTWQGEIIPQEGQQIMWKYPAEMVGISMPPADLPLVEKLKEML